MQDTTLQALRGTEHPWRKPARRPYAACGRRRRDGARCCLPDVRPRYNLTACDAIVRARRPSRRRLRAARCLGPRSVLDSARPGAELKDADVADIPDPRRATAGAVRARTHPRRGERPLIPLRLPGHGRGGRRPAILGGYAGVAGQPCRITRSSAERRRRLAGPGSGPHPLPRLRARPRRPAHIPDHAS